MRPTTKPNPNPLAYERLVALLGACELASDLAHEVVSPDADVGFVRRGSEILHDTLDCLFNGLEEQ